MAKTRRQDLAERIRLRSEAALVLLRVCWWLRRRPFPETQRLTADLGQPGTPTVRSSPSELAWSVTSVSRLVPGARCLAQALATQVLLSRRGMSCEIHFGVPINRERDFIAHAWVTHADEVIIGGPTSGYRELKPPTDSQSAGPLVRSAPR